MLEKIKKMTQSNNKHLRQVKKWQTVWNNLEKSQMVANPDPALQEFYIKQLTGWIEIFRQYKEEFATLEEKVAESYKDMMRRYKSLLQDACHQYHLEGESDSFTVDGLIKIRLDKEKNQAMVNGKKIPNLSVRLVTEAIDKAYKQIWQRDFNPVAFLGELLTFYNALCNNKFIAAGEPVPIKEVYKKLHEKNKKYTPEMFAADLSRLIESGVESDKEDNKLVLAPVRDPKKAVYVYDRQKHNGRYLGLIHFEKETPK
jgi:hypothetical protein